MSNNTTFSFAGSETAEEGVRQTAFTYCCECGTYDAHLDSCLCCGFDFRSAPLDVPPAE